MAEKPEDNEENYTLALETLLSRYPSAKQEWMEENYKSLHLESGSSVHYQEANCYFWIDGREVESLYLEKLDCFVSAPSGFRYPVSLQFEKEENEGVVRICCRYRPLECGNHTAFLCFQVQAEQFQSSIPLIVSRNYNNIRPLPAVKIECEINDLTGVRQARNTFGIACNNETETIAIADCKNNEILIYGADGEYYFRFGRLGNFPGQFIQPVALAFDLPGRRLLVVDKNNHRIQLFTFAGVFLSSFGSRGVNPGQLNFPSSITVSNDGQLIVVADSRNRRIQFFDSGGRFLKQIGDGVFKYPIAVTFDQRGKNVFVSDFNLHRIFKVDVDTGTCDLLLDDADLFRPSGITVDDSGNIVVCDSMNNSVKILDSTTGKLLHSIRSIGNQPFDLPQDVGLLRAGYLTVLNHKGSILIF